MKLRRQLIEARHARARASMARERAVRCVEPLRHCIDANPLVSVAAAGGGGLLAGCLSGRGGKSVIELWNDPTLRWLRGLLGTWVVETFEAKK